MKSVNQMFRHLQNLLNSARKSKRSGARGSLDRVEAVESRMLLTTVQDALFDAVILNDLGDGQQIDSWFVKFTEPQSAEQLTQTYGATSVTESTLIPNGYVLELSSGLTVDQAAADFSSADGFEYMYPNIERTFSTRAIPNDPLFTDQWHLNNTGQSGGLVGADANVTNVWDNYTGEGVTIAIVDDGFDYDHEDLAANANTTIDFDYNGNDADPSPESGDAHGTAVGGVAGAVGNNGVGVSGSAWDAELVGIRLIAAGFSDATGAAALTHEMDQIDIYNNSWGPPDNGRLHTIGPQQRAALETSATTGRNGLGNIHTWAAGNGGDRTNDNVNYDPFANSRFTIAVGALTNSGVRSDYSDVGASLILTAYSNGGTLGITTTDVTGANGYNATNYDANFGGTSSATPLVSGVIALMLEANPNLTYRDVTDILARNSERVDPNNTDWVQNGAGLWVNHEYGFGGVDAEAYVNAALSHVNLAEEQSYTTGQQPVNAGLNQGQTVERTVTVPQSENLSLEYVEIVVDATHTHVGDLDVVLVSPSGTESILAEQRIDPTQGFNSFVFTSARHWGENSAGEWTIRMTDNGTNGSGSFDAFRLNLYGSDPVGLLVVESNNSTVVSDYTQTDQIQVSLPIPPTSDVVIDIANADSTEVELSASRLTFTPNNWDTPQTISLNGVLDLVADGPQQTALTFSVNDALSDDLYDGLDPIVVTVTSIDDDRDIPFKPTLTDPEQFPDTNSPIFAWVPGGDRANYFSLAVTDVLTGVTLQQQSNIVATTFSFDLPFPDGLYSAQVTAFNAADQPGEASDPLIFNIGDPIVPAAPLIVSPDTGDIVQTSFPAIEWNAVPGAAEYEIFIRSGQAVTRLHTAGVDEGNGLLSYTPTQPLNEGPTSVWIRGVNFFGTYGDWSAPVRFTINSVDLPGVPRLTAPLLSVTSNAFPIFEWTAVQNAARYELWVAELREGTGTAQVQAIYDRVIHVTNTNETSYQHFNPLSERPHRAWVRAFNSAGETSGWSSFISFAVDIPEPVVPSVAGNSNTQDLTPTFSWSTAGETPGTTYRLWVNNLSTGQNRVVDVSGIEGGTYTPPANLAQGRLAVWVQASTASGVKSAWSPRAIVNLDVLPPDRSVVIGPRVEEGSTSTVVESEFPTWEWQAVPNAERYELWVNHVESGTVRLIHRTDLTDTTYTHDTPVLEGNLRAWIRGINEADEVGPWSPVFDVAIDVPLPSKPVIGSPTPNAVGAVEDATPIIGWNIANPGITYDVQVRDVVSGDLVINVTGVEGLSYQVLSELDERRFETRVRGENSVGEPGEWSDWYGFRIDVPNATTPTAISPTGTVTSNNVNFTWAHSSDSVRYEILVQDLRNRENTVINVTSFDIDPINGNASYTDSLANGTYRFWVRAFNSQNTASGWSNSLAFTVENRLAKLETEEDPDTLMVSLEVGQTSARTERADVPVEHPQSNADASNTEQPPTHPVTVAMQSNDAGEMIIQKVMAELAEANDSVIL